MTTKTRKRKQASSSLLFSRSSSRKGQAAIEYLMNYAWAIALIIIVGVAIFGLNIGGIRNSLTSQSSQITQAGEQVAVIGYTCDSTDVDVAVQNNGADKITGLTITVDGISGTDGSQGVTCTPDDSTLFPGDTTSCTAAVTCSTPGDPYELGIQLDYTDDRTGLNKKPIRNLTGTAQA